MSNLGTFLSRARGDLASSVVMNRGHGNRGHGNRRHDESDFKGSPEQITARWELDAQRFQDEFLAALSPEMRETIANLTPEKMVEMLKEADADFDVSNRSSWGAAMYAVLGDNDVAKRLIEAGAKVDTKTKSNDPDDDMDYSGFMGM